MFQDSLLKLPASLLLCLLSLSTAQAKSPVPSPEASTDLICHTAHASECYPAIFQPTIHFKRIHDDQSLPPGLHVRMNLATGLKEARLNVPEPDDTPKADLVIIDDVKPSRIEAGRREEEGGGGKGFVEVEEEDVPTEDIQDQSFPDRDYPYLPDIFDPEESSLFSSATNSLLSSSPCTLAEGSPESFLSTLTTLTDLCHSHHWGLSLTRSPSLVQKLINTLNPPFSFPDIPTEIRSAAALLLGTAIQNNPEARNALLSHTKNTTEEPTQTLMQAILSTLQTPLETLPTLHTRTLFLLNQLSHAPTQLTTFLSTSGLSTLHTLFSPPSTSIQPDLHNCIKLRQRIANFMLDHALPAFEGEAGRDLAVNIAGEPGGMPSQDYAKVRHWGKDLDDGEMALLKVLEPWSEAFGAALGEYEVFLYGKEEGNLPGVNGVYSSVWEATTLLKRVLGMD